MTHHKDIIEELYADVELCKTLSNISLPAEEVTSDDLEESKEHDGGIYLIVQRNRIAKISLCMLRSVAGDWNLG